MDEKLVTRIVIDLTNWDWGTPCGCILYGVMNEEIESDYCGDEKDYENFIQNCGHQIAIYCDVEVLIDSDDLKWDGVRTALIEFATKVSNKVKAIIEKR